MASLPEHHAEAFFIRRYTLTLSSPSQPTNHLATQTTLRHRTCPFTGWGGCMDIIHRRSHTHTHTQTHTHNHTQAEVPSLLAEAPPWLAHWHRGCMDITHTQTHTHTDTHTHTHNTTQAELPSFLVEAPVLLAWGCAGCMHTIGGDLLVS